MTSLVPEVAAEVPIAKDSPLRYLELVALTKEDSGIVRAGLFHVKDLYSEYLAKGEASRGKGFMVKDVDYERSGALIVMGAESKWIYMGVNIAVPAKSKSSQTSVPKGVADRRESLLERIRASRAKRAGAVPVTPPAPTQPAKVMAPEKLKTHLQNYQMNLIRDAGKSGPPLPMPLTPKMDDQLVNEGVLPPR